MRIILTLYVYLYLARVYDFKKVAKANDRLTYDILIRL